MDQQLQKPRKPREEYEAQAMLLGLTFDPDTHTFWGNKDGIIDNPIKEWDADTMRELTPREAGQRMRAVVDGGIRSVTPDGNHGQE